MNRREASKIKTRQLIIQATRKLLMEKKVEHCTMRSIAREAGVSAASVVVHFKNKQALLEAALTEEIDRTIALAIASLPASGSLVEKLVHIWRAMYIFYDTNRDLYRSLIRSTIFEPEEKTPYIASQLEHFFFFLSQMIEEEKACARISSAVDSTLMAQSLACLYIGVLIMFYRNPGMTPTEAVATVSAMTRQILLGVAVDDNKE
jgi:AcrR family transcriptional regulator